jgi:four helix bundle protein
MDTARPFKSYKNLKVWQKSIELVRLIYKITNRFPKSEVFSLVSQIRRAAISIPSNIAEGYGRKSHKEYLQYYSITYGSALETETQLIISKDLGFITEKEFDAVSCLLTEIIKMLYVMVFKAP